MNVGSSGRRRDVGSGAWATEIGIFELVSPMAQRFEQTLNII